MTKGKKREKGRKTFKDLKVVIPYVLNLPFLDYGLLNEVVLGRRRRLI